MWGFEMFGKRAEKQQPARRSEQNATLLSPAQVEAAAAEADAAIAKAKLTGDIRISNPHNPNQYGAEHSVGPRTEVRQPTPVTKDGAEDLRINPDLLEQSLENPTELGGPAPVKSSADVLQAAARAESLYVDPKQIEAALVSGKMPDAITIKKAPWQPDMFVEPKTRPISPTPMGTRDDLLTKGRVQGVEDDWAAAKRASRVDNPEGFKSLRTMGGVKGVEGDWEAAKRAVEGSKSEQGLGVFRTTSTTSEKMTAKRERVGTGISEKRKSELRQNAEQLILGLRKLIDATKDTAELKSMRARLTMAEQFYDENFK